MSEEPKKFCRDCFHLKILPDNNDRIDYDRYLCARFKPIVTYDLVTGKANINYNTLNAFEERKDPMYKWRDTCGPDGKFWSLK